MIPHYNGRIIEFDKHQTFVIHRKNVTSLVRELKISLETYPRLGEFDKIQQVSLDVKCLTLILAAVEMEKLQLDEKKYSESHIEKAEKNLYKIRSILNHEGVTLRALKMLNCADDSVVEASLRLLSSLLEGGHKPCQTSILDYFKSTAEEEFFIIVKDRLMASMVSIKEARNLVAMKEARLEKEKKLYTATKKASTVKRSSVKNRTIEREASEIEMTTPPAYQEKLETVSFEADEDDDDEIIEEFLSFDQIVGLVQPIFRVLQLLCENHNMSLREYLREQPDNLKSFNMIKEVANYLGVVFTNIDQYSIQLVIQVLESLNEFSMGNVENQLVLFDSKAMDVVNQLMRRPANDFQGCSRQDVAELKEKAITLVVTMLEDNSKVARNLAKQVLAMLDLEALFENLLHYGSLKTEEDEEADAFKGVVFESTYVLARLKVLLERDDSITDRERKMIDKKLELFLFSENKDKMSALVTKYQAKGYHNVSQSCKEWTSQFESIEILVEGELQQVYFPAPSRDNLDQRMRDELLFNVNRESPSERIRDFIERGRIIQDQMKFLKKLNTNHFSRVIVSSVGTVYWLVLVVTLALNGFSLITWVGDEDPRNPLPVVESWYYYVLFLLGTVHIGLSVFVCLGHFLTDPPIAFGQRDEPEPEEKIDFDEEDEDDEDEDDEKGVAGVQDEDVKENQRRISKAKKKENKKEKENEKAAAASSKPFTDIMMEYINTALSFVRFSDIYHVAFLAMSVLGLVTSGYTYCFHLLHVVVGNDILLRVLQAVTKNGTSMLWVGALGMIVIYIYTVIAFAYMRDTFDQEEYLYCDNLWECFVTMLDYGLRNGGGMGDSLNSPSKSWEDFAPKVIYDLSFFIIITTIGLNIIFGIIVDTFSELRDERFRIVEDMQSICFICGLPSYDFEKRASGFEHHIKKEHNMWSYLLFSIYLEEKDPTEYTFFESNVANQIARDEMGYFPIHRAMALSQENNTIEDRLDNISKTLDILVNRFKEEDLRKAEEKQLTQYQEWKAAKEQKSH